jgi:hypothetical protein
MLLPIGGVAMLEGRPKRPWHELVIALAGPAVNVVIAALLAIPAGAALFALPLGSEASMTQLLEPSLSSLLVWLFLANVSLAVFNMIPALPMDGGRVFRALLAMVLDAPRATRIASVVGQVLAVGMGTWAVLQGHLMLSFIAVMVFFAARRERQEEDMRSALSGIDARAISRRFGSAVQPTTRVVEALDTLIATQQWELPVVDGGWLVGVVSRDRILEAAHNGPWTAIVCDADRDGHDQPRHHPLGLGPTEVTTRADVLQDAQPAESHRRASRHRLCLLDDTDDDASFLAGCDRRALRAWHPGDAWLLAVVAGAVIVWTAARNVPPGDRRGGRAGAERHRHRCEVREWRRGVRRAESGRDTAGRVLSIGVRRCGG